MKAFKETVRKYYKYQTWTQPILTANGTMGGNAFACNQSAYYTENDGTKRLAYQAFDADTSDTRWQVNNINLNSWYNIEWYNPEALYITSLHIRNSGDLGDYTVKDYVLYGSDNGSNWIELTSGTNNNVTSNNKWTIIVNLIEAYKYFRLSCKGRVTKSVMIRNISINAYTGIEESTSSDYDFYRDINTYKMLAEESKIYYDELTFEPSSLLQKLVVPIGITKVHVDCVASKGKDASLAGGKGGRVQCDLKVTPGQTLYFVVGETNPDRRVAAYNASDIRTDNTGITNQTSLESRLIVAGGGGSSTAWTYNAVGGDGGGLIGGDGGNAGNNETATGGTQTEGGKRGGSSKSGYGQNGKFGLGGNANDSGGAGGAGWYGGGGGGDYDHDKKVWCAGGGGGSSYTDSALCSNVIHTQGYNDGEGYITISTLNGEHFYKDVIVCKAFKI